MRGPELSPDATCECDEWLTIRNDFLDNKIEFLAPSEIEASFSLPTARIRSSGDTNGEKVWTLAGIL